MPEIPEFTDDQWTEMVERLALYADTKLQKLCWRGVPFKKGGAPPGGVCAADIASEAITDWLDGKRNWDRAKNPELFQFLKATVDSKINHLAESLENRKSRRVDKPYGNPGPAHHMPSGEPEPGTVVADQEQLHRFRAAMIDGVGRDEAAGKVFECLEAEYTKPAEIAELLDMSLADVNNAQKRLRRVANKVRTNLEGKAR